MVIREDEGFMRAIAEAPEEDVPRLIYADWLEERGKADRAAFIRVQCALARCEDEEERDRLGAIERRLLLRHQHRRDWVPQAVRKHAGGWAFERGVVARAKLKARELLKRGKEIRAEAPIRHLDVTEVTEGQIATAAQLGLLDGLASLDLSDLPQVWDHRGRWQTFPMNDWLMPRLAVAGIAELGLDPEAVASVSRAWARGSAEMPAFAIGHRRSGGEQHLRAIAAESCRRNLFRARMHGVSLGRFFGTYLAAQLDGLEDLRMEAITGRVPWEPHPWEWRQSAGERSPRHLRSLTIRHGELWPDDLRRLFEAPRLAGLSRFDLHNVRPEQADWSDCLRDVGHPTLRSLSIIDGDDLASALSDRSQPIWDRFPSLMHLAAGGAAPDRGDALLGLLADSGLAARLRSLILRGFDVTPSGIDAFRRSGVLTRLHVLELYCDEIGDDVADALAAIGPWPSLELFTLKGRGIGRRARQDLCRAFGPLLVQ